MSPKTWLLAALCFAVVIAADARHRFNTQQRHHEQQEIVGSVGATEGAHLARCEEDEYLCRGRQRLCIPNDWRCDRDYDCPQRDDEQGCLYTCPNQEFTCGDGNCIPSGWRCDGDNDCPDGSDESFQTCRQSRETNRPSGLGQA